MQKYLKAAIELQSVIAKATAQAQKARGKADQTEYVQYCTLLAHCVSNGIKKRTKPMNEVKTALEEAGRSERNVVSVVQIVAHTKLAKLLTTSHEGLIASITPENVVTILAGEHDLDTVSKLRRYCEGTPNKVKVEIEKLTQWYAKAPSEVEAIYAAMQRIVEAQS